MIDTSTFLQLDDLLSENIIVETYMEDERTAFAVYPKTRFYITLSNDTVISFIIEDVRIEDARNI